MNSGPEDTDTPDIPVIDFGDDGEYGGVGETPDQEG